MPAVDKYLTAHILRASTQSRTKMQLKLEDLDFPPPDFHHYGDPGVTVAFRNFAAKAREQA
jgi:hypothetical protein